MMPLTADIFVFVYPVYLSALYLFGLYRKQQDYKHLALLLFFSGFGSILVNYLFKAFLYKTRPLDDRSRDDLILQLIPENAFPSDHAAMSSAIATVTIIYGLRHRHR
jgi:membrane-associated phospholipid phosphatase